MSLPASNTTPDTSQPKIKQNHEWTHEQRVYLWLLKSKTDIKPAIQHAMFNRLCNTTLGPTALRSQLKEATRKDRPVAAYWTDIVNSVRDDPDQYREQLVQIVCEAIRMGVEEPYLV